MFQGVSVTYLLDTNALLFSFANKKELSNKAKEIIETEENLCVSIASLWEIAIKQSIGKLSVSLTIPEFQSTCNERNIEIIPIRPKELESIKSLPAIHNDPFDRLIIAQAITMNASIVTRDSQIPKYPVHVEW